MLTGRIAQDSLLSMLVLNLRGKKILQAKTERDKEYINKPEARRFWVSNVLKN